MKQLVWTATATGEGSIKVKELQRRLVETAALANVFGYGDEPLVDLVEEAWRYIEDHEYIEDEDNSEAYVRHLGDQGYWEARADEERYGGF